MKPGRRRALVRYLQDRYRVSERRGCAVLRFDRSSHRYRSYRDDQAFLQYRIREIAASRIRYGYRRIYVALRREGMVVNHKRVRRLYREKGLNLRIKRPRRRVSAAHRTERVPATAPNQAWSMDFVSDALFDGRRLRALTLLDVFTREGLAIEVDKGITAEQVAAILDTALAVRPAPQRIRSTTVRSSSRTLSISGPTSTASRSTSAGRADRSTMPSSNPSTVASARSV